jgi:hypothetical protein
VINLCLQLILTNEKYRRLISILLPLTGFASAGRRSIERRTVRRLQTAVRSDVTTFLMQTGNTSRL